MNEPSSMTRNAAAKLPPVAEPVPPPEELVPWVEAVFDELERRYGIERQTTAPDTSTQESKQQTSALREP